MKGFHGHELYEDDHLTHQTVCERLPDIVSIYMYLFNKSEKI